MTPEALAALHARAMTTPRPYTAAAFAELLATPGTFLQGDAGASPLAAPPWTRPSC